MLVIYVHSWPIEIGIFWRNIASSTMQSTPNQQETIRFMPFRNFLTEWMATTTKTTIQLKQTNEPKWTVFSVILNLKWDFCELFKLFFFVLNNIHKQKKKKEQSKWVFNFEISYFDRFERWCVKRLWNRRQIKSQMNCQTVLNQRRRIERANHSLKHLSFIHTSFVGKHS